MSPLRPKVLYGVLALFFAIVATYRFFDFTERVDDLLHGQEHVRGRSTSICPSSS